MIRNGSIGHKIDMISDIIGNELDTSYEKEELFARQRKDLDNSWRIIRQREEKYADNKMKLTQIKNEISAARKILEEDIKNAKDLFDSQNSLETAKLRDFNSNGNEARIKEHDILLQIEACNARLNRLKNTENMINQKEREVERVMDNIRQQDLENKIDSLRYQTRDLEYNIDDMKTKIDEYELRRKNNNAKLNKARRECSILNDRKTVIMDKIHALKMEQLTEKSEKERQIRRQATDLSLFKRETEDSKEKRDEISKKKVNINNETQRKEADEQVLRKQINKLKEEVSEKERDLKKTTIQINLLRDKEGKLRTKREKRENSVQDTFSQIREKKESYKIQTEKEKNGMIDYDAKYKKAQEKNAKIIEELGKAAEQEEQIENIAKTIDREFFSINYQSQYQNEKLHQKLLDEYNEVSKELAKAKVKESENSKMLESNEKFVINSNEEMKKQQKGILTLHKKVKEVLARNLELRKIVHVLERKIDAKESHKFVVSAKSEIANSNKELGILQLSNANSSLKEINDKIQSTQKRIATKRKSIKNLSKSFTNYDDIDPDELEEKEKAVENIKDFLDSIKSEQRKLSAIRDDQTTQTISEWSSKVRFFISSFK